METESILIILLIAAGVVGLLLFLTRKKDDKTVTPTPTITSTMKTSSTPAAKPPAGTPAVRYTQPAVQKDPTITIFEDRMIRQVRRCPSCDGENSIYARGCEICGRRL